jgi:hypothetical protein
MHSIIIHDADWKVTRLDELVKKGVFSSRAEAYRAGALLVATLPTAHELSTLGQLDSSLYGLRLKKCLSELKRGNPQGAKMELSMVLTALRVRSLIGPLLGEKNARSEDYESLANDLSHYDETLSQFDKLDKRTQTELIRDLKRDIGALIEGLKEIETSAQRRTR